VWNEPVSHWGNSCWAMMDSDDDDDR
jgi:hypothetical protein